MIGIAIAMVKIATQIFSVTVILILRTWLIESILAVHSIDPGYINGFSDQTSEIS